MDSGALLDLLGNENRRRILRLLSQKPCYVTEISDNLNVSPKAVIDHLRKLEEAGLVDSRTDRNRRKYFYIANNVRLEVNVSQYGYGAKSAYPASSSFDLTGCEHLSVDLEGPTASDDTTEDITSLAADLKRLEQLENELSLAQRLVQRRLIDTIASASQTVNGDEDAALEGRLAFEVLVILAKEPRSVDEIAHRIDAPRPIVEDMLTELREQGVITPDEDGWGLAT